MKDSNLERVGLIPSSLEKKKTRTSSRSPQQQPSPPFTGQVHISIVANSLSAFSLSSVLHTQREMALRHRVYDWNMPMQRFQRLARPPANLITCAAHHASLMTEGGKADHTNSKLELAYIASFTLSCVARMLVIFPLRVSHQPLRKGHQNVRPRSCAAPISFSQLRIAIGSDSVGVLENISISCDVSFLDSPIA